MQPRQASGIALLAALCWGAGNVAQKTILDHLDPWSAAGLTGMIGALVLVPLMRRERHRAPVAPRGASWPLMLFITLLFALASVLLQVGYGLTTVTNGGFLVNTSAILTPVIGWLWLRQRPVLAIWPACGVTLAGVYLMAGANWVGLSPGDLLALLSALVFAVWTLAVGVHVMRHRRPVLLTVVQLAGSGVICAGVGLLRHGPPPIGALTAALPEILYLGVVAKGVAYLLMVTAQQHLSATVVGILVSAEAVFGALMASFLLDETLTPLRGAGAFLILTGVIIAARIPPAPLPALQDAATDRWSRRIRG
jgi:drug/metabolite transporter (DMT)-like permease